MNYSLKKCLDFLKIEKLGKKLELLPDVDKGYIVVLAKTVNGNFKYVVSKWNNDESKYGIAYDPDINSGFILGVYEVYLTTEEPKDEIVEEIKTKVSKPSKSQKIK